ncbi:hypothetical protein M9458_058139, partial [Cirrhinus mrigala]
MVHSTLRQKLTHLGTPFLPNLPEILLHNVSEVATLHWPMPAKMAIMGGASAAIYMSWRHKLRIFLFQPISYSKTAVEKTQEDWFPSCRSSMSKVCMLCSGPIEVLDTHKFCILCLGLAHAEAALAGSDCPHCEEFSLRTLKSRRSVALGDFSLERPTTTSEPLVGPQPHTTDRAPRKGASPPRSPVCFAEESLRPTPGASEIISFGAEEGDDLDEAMSLTASEKDWAPASEERSEVEGHTAFQDELISILTRAVSDLGLEWEKANEPARTHIADKAYATSGEAAQLLKSIDEGKEDPEAFKDMRAGTDFTLKATKKMAQADGAWAIWWCSTGICGSLSLSSRTQTEVHCSTPPHSRTCIVVTRKCLNALEPWRDRNHTVTRWKIITTDASMAGWGAHCDGVPASGRWTESERLWHINHLELRAVFLALQSFITQVRGHHVLIRIDSMSMVLYINRQGEVHSRALHEQAARLLLWANCHLLSIQAAHVPGCLNSSVDMLSRSIIPHGEWRLNHRTVKLIWDQFGKAEVDVFATEENMHCPLFFSLDAFTMPWPKARLYAFPTLKILPQVLHKLEERASVLLIALYWPNRPWFPDLLELLTAPPWLIPLRRDLLSQAGGLIWHPNPE